MPSGDSENGDLLRFTKTRNCENLLRSNEKTRRSVFVNEEKRG